MLRAPPGASARASPFPRWWVRGPPCGLLPLLMIYKKEEYSDMKKKIISSILSLVMLLSLFPVSAFAAGTITDNGKIATDGDTTVILARMVDKDDSTAVLNSDYKITAIAKNNNVIDVTVTAKDVVSHTNGNDAEGYWLGIGIPKPADGATIKQGWGPATLGETELAGQSGSDSKEWVKDGKVVYTDPGEGGAEYWTYYFNANVTHLTGANPFGYITVTSGETTITYKITFSDVTLLASGADVIAANLTGATAEKPQGDNATSYNATLTNGTVSVTATGLKLHKNGAGTYGYWVGVGVPYTEGLQCAWGFGDYPSNPEFKDVSGRLQTKNSAQYATCYFASDQFSTENKGYIAAKIGNVITLYKLNFSGITQVAPLSVANFDGDTGLGSVNGSTLATLTAGAVDANKTITVTGTSRYKNWDAFSSVADQKFGNYVVLSLTNNVPNSVIEITSPSENNLLKYIEGASGAWAIRLQNFNPNFKPVVKIKESKAADAAVIYEATLDLSKIVREPMAITAVAASDSLNARYENGKVYLSGSVTYDAEASSKEVTLTFTVDGQTVTAKTTVSGTGNSLTATAVKVLGTDITVDATGLYVPNDDVEAEPAVVPPAVPAVPANEPEGVKKQAMQALATNASDNTKLSIEDSVLTNVAAQEANKETTPLNTALEQVSVPAGIGSSDPLKKISDAVDAVKGDSDATVSDVKLAVQVYMDVAVKDATSTDITFSITPMKQTILTTVTNLTDDAGTIEVYNGKTGVDSNVSSANAVAVGSAVPVTVSVPTVVKLPLPSGAFANGTYTVKHVHGSNTYYYEGTVASDVLTFTSLNGFSDFTVLAVSPCEAKIGDVQYETLAEAVAAVTEGQTIVLLKSVTTGDITLTGDSKNFFIDINSNTLKTELFKNATVSGGPSPYTVSYTKPTTPVNPGGDHGSGGNGGGTTTGNAVTVSPSTNGKVSVNPANAEKGATVTITAPPNTGYEVGTVTVKDASGNTVAVTKVNDTQYTFVMPDGKVSVDATFTQVQQPSDEPFVDVSASDYFYDAVKWAVDKGITTGDGVNTFGPNKSCTRAQMVTFLWRAAGSPAATGSNPFADVPAGEYYTDAVLWAVSQGITNGTGADSFSPNATVSRGQTVTFLYRYAGSPSVNAGDAFNDVAATDYYANAVQWAVTNGITNGTGNGTFSPVNDCTRGQIVTFMYRQMAE